MEKDKKRRAFKFDSIYMSSELTKQVILPINVVGENLKSNLQKFLQKTIEGRCIVDGFIKPGSIDIKTYSSGMCKGSDIIFEVAFVCDICSPVEGMLINCIAENITKAGIKAVTKEELSPVVIFIARDHHHTSKYFSTIEEGQEIMIKVLGQRFELYDSYISVIGEVIEPKEPKLKKKTKPKLIFKET